MDPRLSLIVTLLAIAVSSQAGHVNQDVIDATEKRNIVMAGSIIKATAASMNLLTKILTASASSSVMAISLSNFATVSLVYPRAYLYAGRSMQVLPKIIKPKEAALLSFENSQMAAGTEGLISYRIEKTKYYLFVFWQVPFTTVFGLKNRYWVGISPEPADAMYFRVCLAESYSAEIFQWRKKTSSKTGFQVEAAMLNNPKSAMEVHFQNYHE